MSLDMRVWVNTNTGTAHRDPGCSRLFIAGASPVKEHEKRPPGAKRCSYCYSRAGYRRYPARTR